MEALPSQPVDQLDETLGRQKTALLSLFRQKLEDRSSEISGASHKQKATAVNRVVSAEYKLLRERIVDSAARNEWAPSSTVEALLAVHYCSSVVMVEARNSVWPYDYMAFSRRMGELWQPFCLNCFDYPSTDLKRITPPTFNDIKDGHEAELMDYVRSLDLTDVEQGQLLTYYREVWRLVDSGEINLELDLHFRFEGNPYAVDFKSAFGSNEKGNTNRLLLVASLMQIVSPPHTCLLWVRADEEGNNAYFRTLQRSAFWRATCGTETYEEIRRYSGFDLSSWIGQNVDWLGDLDSQTSNFLIKNGLSRYATW